MARSRSWSTVTDQTKRGERSWGSRGRHHEHEHGTERYVCHAHGIGKRLGLRLGLEVGLMLGLGLGLMLAAQTQVQPLRRPHHAAHPCVLCLYIADGGGGRNGYLHLIGQSRHHHRHSCCGGDVF
jgi:hypothetical protein